jgi:hypothetical protein
MSSNVNTWLTQEIELYVSPGVYKVDPICYSSKNDWGRRIRVHLMDKPGVKFSGLTNSMTVTVRCRRPDRYIHMTLVDSDCIDGTNGIIDIVTDRGMTSIAGECLCNIEIIDGSTIINTQNFILMVEGC